MAVSTYPELIARIKEMPGLEAAPAWQFVADAEADLRGIQHFRMEKRTRIKCAAHNDSLALPDDFLALRTFTLDGVPVKPMGAHNENANDGVLRYRISGPSIVLSSPLTQSLTFTATYRAKIPTLSEAAPTNWLLTEFPMVIYHSAMIHAYEWLKDVEGENASRNRAAEAITLLQTDHKKGQFGGNTPVLGL